MDLIRKIALSRVAAGAGAAFLLGLSSLASGQTRTINSTGHIDVGPSAITSTYDVVPQISPDPPYNPQMAAENDITPKPPTERANSLRAGGLLSVGRGVKTGYFPGPVDGRWAPPDNQMAVGPNYIVCCVNTTLAFYTKSGTKVFQQQFDGSSGFFNGVASTNFIFDPKCFYDPISQRFFVLSDDGASGSANGVVLAVSDDSNPNGTWYKYRFDTVYNGSWLDYPGFGFNKDAIVVTGNLFDGSGGGIEVLVIKKAPLLTGGTSTATIFNDPTTFTCQPTRTTDGTLDKIFGVASGGGNAIRMFAFTNLTGTPVLKSVDVPVPNYSRPIGPAHSLGNLIDALDGRQMTANYRFGRVVAAHTIGNGSVNAVRWYDFNMGTWPSSGAPSLKQSGTISQANTDIHMPAINMNVFEDIAVFYTRSSSSIVADLCVSSRKKTDALGQIGQPVKLFGSPNGGYGGRWGDYFANEIDPLDDSTFWGFGMGIAGGGYTTQVLSWQVTTGGLVGNPLPADSINTYLGAYIIGDQTSVWNADHIEYQAGSIGIPQFGQAAGVEADFTAPTDTANMSINFATNGGIAGGTNMVWAFNWGTQAWDLIGSTPLAASGNASKVLTVRTTDVPKYLGAGGAVKIRLRGHFPIKPFNNAMPNPFTYHIDLLQVVVR